MSSELSGQVVPAAGDLAVAALRSATQRLIGTRCAQAALVPAWRSADWLTLRVLGDFTSATQRQWAMALTDYDAVLTSGDQVRVVLALHAREVLRAWPGRLTIETISTVARRGGLVACDWHDGWGRCSLTDTGRAVFAAIEAPLPGTHTTTTPAAHS
ncbi:hypothetical protein [Saccharopolyspora erythraea]|uniref:hypothetical protein n=1 Tax=Saccharopolyspora erythraea TaxID=1836 RepID=UPI00117B4664|nr:hypothetical protein [Saccharopolyspora erythraea]QRK88045.1 hypothetical protein JQX30_25370 [Saccharopolyspora erythraea]